MHIYLEIINLNNTQLKLSIMANLLELDCTLISPEELTSIERFINIHELNQR